jgi:hypothetical protein
LPGVARSKDSLRSAQRPPGGGTKASGLRIHYAAEALSTQLLADAEFGDDALVTFGIVLFQVVEQATTLADEHEQTATRAVVFLVRLEVLCELTDALAQQRDLYLGATGIGSVRRIRVNEGLFLLSG